MYIAWHAMFHVEIEPDTVANWAKIPAYSEALEKAMGPGAVDRLAADCDRHMDEFNRLAERLYMNWLQTSAKA